MNKEDKKEEVLEFNLDNLSNVDIKVLKNELISFRKELFNLRFQKKSGELTNTSRFAKIRKSIAKIKTEVSRRKKLERVSNA